MHQAHQHPHQHKTQQQQQKMKEELQLRTRPTANKVAAENGRRWQRTNLIYAQDMANYFTQEINIIKTKKGMNSLMNSYCLNKRLECEIYYNEIEENYSF